MAPKVSFDTREEKNLLSKPEIKPGFPGCQAHTAGITATTLRQLLEMIHKTMILPPLLLQLFQNTALRKIFESTKTKQMGK